MQSAGSSWSGWNFHWITICDGRLSNTSGTNRNVSVADGVALLVKAGGTRLSTGKAEISGTGRSGENVVECVICCSILCL